MAQTATLRILRRSLCFKIVFPNTKIGSSRVATNSGFSKHSFLQCKGALGRQIVKREKHLKCLRDIGDR